MEDLIQLKGVGAATANVIVAWQTKTPLTLEGLIKDFAAAGFKKMCTPQDWAKFYKEGLIAAPIIGKELDAVKLEMSVEEALTALQGNLVTMTTSLNDSIQTMTSSISSMTVKMSSDREEFSTRLEALEQHGVRMDRLESSLQQLQAPGKDGMNPPPAGKQDSATWTDQHAEDPSSHKKLDGPTTKAGSKTTPEEKDQRQKDLWRLQGMWDDRVQVSSEQELMKQRSKAIDQLQNQYGLPPHSKQQQAGATGGGYDSKGGYHFKKEARTDDDDEEEDDGDNDLASEFKFGIGAIPKEK